MGRWGTILVKTQERQLISMIKFIIHRLPQIAQLDKNHTRTWYIEAWAPQNFTSPPSSRGGRRQGGGMHKVRSRVANEIT